MCLHHGSPWIMSRGNTAKTDLISETDPNSNPYHGHVDKLQWHHTVQGLPALNFIKAGQNTGRVCWYKQKASSITCYY
jgi:hypothetical protein